VTITILTELTPSIGSMLREHGTQRPTVFEVLNHVHYLRGTKSQFTYNIPAPAPPLPPRQSTQQISAIPAFSNGPRNTPQAQTTPNAGAQAREKVLEAIAPMRRGRPAPLREPESSSGQRSPQKSTTPLPVNSPPVPSKEGNWLDKEEASWKATTAQLKARDRANALFDEAWNVSGSTAKTSTTKVEPSSARQDPVGFGDDFSEKLWRTSGQTPASADLNPSSAIVLKPSVNASIKALSHTGGTRDKDAFEGLGLMTSIGRPAPTLAEARKLRTGLAIMNSAVHQQRSSLTPSESLSKPLGSAGQSVASRPTPSPRPSYLNPGTMQTNSMSREPSPGPEPTSAPPSWQQHTRGSPSFFNARANEGAVQPDGTPIEARFPSLEEIDAKFPAAALYPSSARLGDRSDNRYSSPAQSKAPVSETPPQLPQRPRYTEEPSTASHSGPSSQSTGLESLQKKFDVPKTDWKSASFSSRDTPASDSLSPPTGLLRPKRSSTTMKYALEGLGGSGSVSGSGTGGVREDKFVREDKYVPEAKFVREDRYVPENKYVREDKYTPENKLGREDKYVPREEKFSHSPKPPPKDWLTGDDSDHNTSTPIRQQTTNRAAVLRDTPAKRTSVVIPRDLKFQSPVTAQPETAYIQREQALEFTARGDQGSKEDDSPSISRFAKAFPPINTLESLDSEGQQASTHHPNEALTDNWSPIDKSPPSLPSRPPTKSVEPVDSASSADEDGPEDLGDLNNARRSVGSLRKRKGRQSSVHDLVDLWGGGVSKDSPRANEPPAAASKPLSFVGGEKATPKPRPISLMPPSHSATPTRIGGGGLSPRVSPIQRDPSPISPAFESGKERTITPSPNRSRPVSMLVFPAKSTDILANSSPGLGLGLPSAMSPSLSSAPPTPGEEEVTQVPRRRTSISNMVQRYEAIGGKIILPQQVSAAGPVTRKASLNKPFLQSQTSSADSATRVKLPGLASNDGFGSAAKISSGPSSSAASTATAFSPSSRDEFKPNRINAEPMKPRTRTTSTGPNTQPRIRTISTGPSTRPIDVPRTNAISSATSPSPVETRKPAEHAAFSSRTATGQGHARELSTNNAVFPPKRKSTLPAEEINSSRSAGAEEGGEVSSSPERPYQGVGRLIDQWQKKSEESSAGGVLPKRAGLVGGAGRS